MQMEPHRHRKAGGGGNVCDKDAGVKVQEMESN